jgi:hypothetical protein
MNHTEKPLSSFLASPNKIIRDNAMSILKQLNRCPHEQWQNVTRAQDPYMSADSAKMRQCTTCGILKPSGMR